MEVLFVDYKKGQKINDRRESSQFIPLELEIKQLLTFLGVDENPGHLHLVVTARAAAAAGTQDEVESRLERYRRFTLDSGITTSESSSNYA